MHSICLFLTILLVTVTNCQKNIPNFKLPQEIGEEIKPCGCRCAIQKDNNKVVKEAVTPVVTACPATVSCLVFCLADCFAMANGALGINYGYRVNSLKGVTCVHDNTTENFDYGNCTNYKNTIPSGSLTDACKDYCEGTVDPPKQEIICPDRRKSSDGTVSEGTKRCNCKCTKQKDKENPLVIQACPQNFDKTECEEFCTKDCPRIIESDDPDHDIYGFYLNDRNGVTCVDDSPTETKYEYENCTNYDNAIPSQSLTDVCGVYCTGTIKFPENSVLCTTKKEVPTKHDEL